MYNILHKGEIIEVNVEIVLGNPFEGRGNRNMLIEKLLFSETLEVNDDDLLVIDGRSRIVEFFYILNKNTKSGIARYSMKLDVRNSGKQINKDLLFNVLYKKFHNELGFIGQEQLHFDEFLSNSNTEILRKIFRVYDWLKMIITYTESKFEEKTIKMLSSIVKKKDIRLVMHLEDPMYFIQYEFKGLMNYSIRILPETDCTNIFLLLRYGALYQSDITKYPKEDSFPIKSFHYINFQSRINHINMNIKNYKEKFNSTISLLN